MASTTNLQMIRGLLPSIADYLKFDRLSLIRSLGLGDGWPAAVGWRNGHRDPPSVPRRGGKWRASRAKAIRQGNIEGNDVGWIASSLHSPTDENVINLAEAHCSMVARCRVQFVFGAIFCKRAPL